MANPEHVARLKQGVVDWNQWRESRSDKAAELLVADLSGADLTGVDLRRAILIKANLSGANLSAANLAKADIREATLIEAHLSKATLIEADLSKADLSKADLSGADLRGATLTEANLRRANLRGANLRGAGLAKADLRGATLIEAHLTKATLIEARLRRAHLSKADLTGADLSAAHLIETELSGANLTKADLRGANLPGATLIEANLRGAHFIAAHLIEANLRGANLRGANFAKADLSGADLSGADLTGAAFVETVFGNCNLGSAVGLDSCSHYGASTIDHRTLTRSGPLPLAFLRGCGLPDRLIEYLPSLLNQPVQFYSCFISYSAKDQSFADRLHADLQNKGVRCWFAPHDMQGGKKIHEQVDEAIRVYDRLLLILSAHSMNSEWVKTELAKARKREQHEKRQMLFPIRLIDFETLRNWECFDADTGKDSAREIREYFIPDFSDWKTNHDHYEIALARLLKDLKPVP